MSLQNIFNVTIVLILVLHFQSERAHDRQIRALFYITDTLRDILIEYFKGEDDERDTL